MWPTHTMEYYHSALKGMKFCMCHNINEPEDMMLRKNCQTQKDKCDDSIYMRYSEQANSLRQKVEQRLRRTEGWGGKGAIV